MAKFMILYNSSVTARNAMAAATPEAIKASMEEWIQWRDVAGKTFKVDFGLPLQAISRVTADDAGSSGCPVNGYSIVEGEAKEELLVLLRTHPHLKRPGASIDVLEMLTMPGLEA
jgi:hypothetical protein